MIQSNSSMKYSEFIRLISRSGWTLARQGKGSHEVWEKDGKTEIVPNHGAKEMPKRSRTDTKKADGGLTPSLLHRF